MRTMVFNILTATLVMAAGPGGAVVLQGEVAQSLGAFGHAVSELEDQDGDGFWEILVGAPLVDATGTDDGRVYLWLGGPEMTAAPNRVYSGNLNEQFGSAVARVGDVNDDGRFDFAVGAPRYSQGGTNRGRVYIFFGGPALDTTPDAILECPSATSGPQFGFSVSAAGDFNGDGIDDLIVGAPYDDTVALDAGSAWVFYGSSSVSQLQTADLALRGALAYDHFGWSVSDGGNFFRDGNACVVVGAPANDTSVTREGTAVVFRGSSSPSPGPDATADLTLRTSSATISRNWFGYAARGLGDWDGDGDADLAVGAPQDDTRGTDAGRVEIFYGGSSPDAISDRYANGQDGGDLFGWSVADVGEITGDSRADLLIGAPGVASDGLDAGRAYVFAGGAASAANADALGFTVAAQGISPGTLPGDRFGACVSAAGNLDGDARRDYAVGAPSGNIATNAESGYVRLYDSSGNVVPALLQSWTAVWAPDGAVRLTFALAEPPDAFRELALWRETIAVSGETLARELACVGALDAAVLPLEFASGQWVLTDRPALLPAGASLRYALVLTTTDGAEWELANLAGPPPLIGPTFEVRPPWPNPFNPRTTISFRAPAGEPVVCRVFDLQGRLVATLFAGGGTGAWQSVDWDGRSNGRPVPAGAYAVLVSAGGQTRTRMAVLAK